MTTDLYTLISGYVQLRKTANTNGGEYHGPCPLCRAGDDRLMVWPNATRPGWRCRQCEKGGDAIQFLREMGYSYADACRLLEIEPSERSAPHLAIVPPAECNPPAAAWRRAAAAFVLFAQGELPKHPGALDYLRNRGLTDATIARFGLGYNPEGRASERAKWGLERDVDPKAKHPDQIWLPAGIVIPAYADDTLWKVQIRRDDVQPGSDRYKTVTGSANVLYGADSIRPGKPAMLVEGPFDAMAVAQVASDLIGVAASGTSGARRPRWYARLALASDVLISLDADDAGDAAARVWIDKLPNARRYRPAYADPAQVLQDGGDLRAWVQAGLRNEPRATVKPIHPEFVGFWQLCLARQNDHLARLRQLCAAGGYDYDATVAWIDAQPMDADAAAILDKDIARAA